jgi:pyruvate formate lyase activating enzyme
MRGLRLESGLIFDIQGYSVHDGPGCRTLVFLSGCPLRCAWCANPEGQLLRSRLMVRQVKCTHTHYRCVSACPHHAVRLDSGSIYPVFDRAVCDRCDTLDCAGACLHEALTIAGRFYNADDLMRILERDQGYWGDRGGVTFGGGEPLVQAEFLLSVLRRCRSAYIRTAIETCAHVDNGVLMQALEWTDWLFADIKHMDSAEHSRGTGASNELILDNIRAVASAGWDGRLMIRVPLVPGFNDTVDNLRATARFVAGLGLTEVNLLPFHRLGASKYEQLGLAYAFAEVAAPTTESIQAARGIFKAAGLRCYVGSDTPF